MGQQQSNEAAVQHVPQRHATTRTRESLHAGGSAKGGEYDPSTVMHQILLHEIQEVEKEMIDKKLITPEALAQAKGLMMTRINSIIKTKGPTGLYVMLTNPPFKEVYEQIADSVNSKVNIVKKAHEKEVRKAIAPPRTSSESEETEGSSGSGAGTGNGNDETDESGSDETEESLEGGDDESSIETSSESDNSETNGESDDSGETGESDEDDDSDDSGESDESPESIEGGATPEENGSGSSSFYQKYLFLVTELMRLFTLIGLVTSVASSRPMSVRTQI